mmetsp:Transcript_15806/g.49509  ORF Transcript_15806/g.49509 Transcript_15806/m.49509 type:complete len:208 (+) Transcript_15806:473-1096(+)
MSIVSQAERDVLGVGVDAANVTRRVFPHGLSSQRPGGPQPSARELLPKVLVVLDHRPRHEVFRLVLSRQVAQQVAALGKVLIARRPEFGVRHPSRVPHERPLVPSPRYRLLGDLQPQGHGVARHALVQTQLIVRELGRQHRDGAGGVVSRSAPLHREPKERRRRRDPARHVGDVNTQHNGLADAAHRQRVVDVPRALVVHREGPLVA